MKVPLAKIDSINFSSNKLEDLLQRKYFIEIAKDVNTFELERWRKCFGEYFKQHIVEAKILHISREISLPIKKFSVNKNTSKQTLEIAGLQSYTDKGKQLRSFLNELLPKIQDEVITRLDIALDFKDEIPSILLKSLEKKRHLFIYKNTCYLKTKSEKKSNRYIGICLYSKSLKEGLNQNLTRLEFRFMGEYFRGNFKVKDMEKVFLKIEKSIKLLIGSKVRITPLSYPIRECSRFCVSIG